MQKKKKKNQVTMASVYLPTPPQLTFLQGRAFCLSFRVAIFWQFQVDFCFQEKLQGEPQLPCQKPGVMNFVSG